jgi:hypothetical protein
LNGFELRNATEMQANFQAQCALARPAEMKSIHICCNFSTGSDKPPISGNQASTLTPVLVVCRDGEVQSNSYTCQRIGSASRLTSQDNTPNNSIASGSILQYRAEQLASSSRSFNDDATPKPTSAGRSLADNTVINMEGGSEVVADRHGWNEHVSQASGRHPDVIPWLQ